MKTLLIDNYDSFTYNLYQLIGEVNGCAPTVLRNDGDFEAIAPHAYDNIVISPGPGHPANTRDFGVSRRALRDATCPVLGVCLGHQGLCDVFGGTIGLAPEPWHGRTSPLFHDDTGVFVGLPSPFEVTRYHSLVVTSLPDILRKNAWTEDGIIMGVAHRTAPLWGVQFHPESVCSAYGRELLANFRDITTRRTSCQASQPTPKVAPLVPHRTHYRVDVRRLDHYPDAADAFSALFRDAPHNFWLDSSADADGVLCFSIMGNSAGPLSEYITYSVEDETVTIRQSDGTQQKAPGPFFDYLDAALRTRHVAAPGDVPFLFNLGYVGYLGYELKAEAGGSKKHTAPTPDAALLFVDRALVIDHVQRCVYLLELRHAHDASPSEWLDTTASALLNVLPPAPRAAVVPLHQALNWQDFVTLRHTRSDYLDLIARCQDEIRQGESYEICLTNMGEVPFIIDPLETYLFLRRVSPTPYAAFLAYPNVAVLSASPERFVSIDNAGNVESKPIKGTRPRGETLQQDVALRDSLANNKKDRAENLMIVDLVRNDLNASCAIGSVHVSKLFAVETYASSHQLVSTVRGTLRPGKSAVDCVRTAFPGGSVTGAPKRRTMEIIDRLEGGARGVYSGALGWFSLSGAVDLSIVIRTIVATPTRTSFGVGGAIIALSDATDEFEETSVKLRAMATALAAQPSRGRGCV